MDTGTAAVGPAGAATSSLEDIVADICDDVTCVGGGGGGGGEICTHDVPLSGS